MKIKVTKHMAIKKSELYSSLYEVCDHLRGGMGPSMYKNYGVQGCAKLNHPGNGKVKMEI